MTVIDAQQPEIATAEPAPIAIARAIIRERMESSPQMQDGALADLLLEEGLTDDVIRALAREGIMANVGSIRRNRRRNTMDRVNRHGKRETRWRGRDAVDDNPDVFQMEWATVSGEKMLGDFTHADAVWTHKWYVEQARGHVKAADKFAKLAKLLPQNSTKTAQTLPREQVEGIFFDA